MLSSLTADDKTRRDELLSMVDQATSEILESPDWGACMLTMEMVNAISREDILTPLVKRLKSRLESKSNGVCMNALTLSEILIRNCHAKFLQRLLALSFKDTLVELALQHSDVSRDRREIAAKDI